ncbi:MAG: ActS/PrrB/RegB family redox-sensitive histidine kinase [Cucumibacter sp.]
MRLETLVRLRWLAVAGQSLSVLFVALVLRYPLPLVPCFVFIALSALLNVGLLLRYPPTHRLRSGTAALQLAYDCLQLAGLLYLTGGLQNPFSILFLAPVSVSATTLPPRLTATLSALVVGLATLLGFSHLPLPWNPARGLEIDALYVAGIWVGLTSGVAFISIYTNRVAHEARQLAAALTATELALAREQHLSTLDGLAAAAAHELGTPLATIALAAREMQTDTETRAALRPDIDLIAEQAARCRAILAKLRSLDPAEPSLFSASSLSDLVAEVAAPHRDFGISIDVTLGETDGPEPSIRRNAGLIYGLGNIIENAVDYSRNRVTVTLSWSARLISVEVVDDGEGFPAELFARLGEPYLTTRPRTARPSDPAEPGGLGLGIFIAKTLLERSGGRLRFSNAEAGARVSIAWPRQRLEVGLDPLNFDAKA